MISAPAPRDGRWKTEGSCAQVPVVADADPWFPTNVANPDTWETPRRICHACPVRDLCLADAMNAEAGLITSGSRWGMWGGLTPKERADLAKATTNLDTQATTRRRRTA
ncbi:MAG: WhiB family transcriptional regulator [Galactobacter sp.]